MPAFARPGNVVAASLLFLFAACPRPVPGQDSTPIDQLLRLTPASSAVVVTLEDMRGQSERFTSSRLAAILRNLPIARAWHDSDRRKTMQQAKARVETVLSAPLEAIRDEVLGDAVVLAIQVPRDESARGHALLLIKPRDRALLERVLAKLNEAQINSGELERVVDKTHAAVTYHARTYPAGSGRVGEWYVTTGEGVFALSDDESIVTALIDRAAAHAKKPGSAAAQPGDEPDSLADSPRFQGLMRLFPGRAAARIVIDPRQVERLFALTSAPRNTEEQHFVSLVQNGLAAVDYAGAALFWDRETISLRMAETLRPARLPAWLKRWAAMKSAADEEDAPPAGTIVSASINLDARALEEALRTLTPGDKTAALEHFEAVLSGLLLGQDLRGTILPALGPRLSLHLASPESIAGEKRPAAVLSLQVSPLATSGRPTAIDAFENALGTVLSLWALDEQHHGSSLRLAHSDVKGARVTSLADSGPFAFAVDRVHGRIVVGSSRLLVTRFLKATRESESQTRFRRLCAVSASASTSTNTTSHVFVDVQEAAKAIEANRDAIVALLARKQARSGEAVAADLSHVLEILREIDALGVEVGIERDGTRAEQRLTVLLKHD